MPAFEEIPAETRGAQDHVEPTTAQGVVLVGEKGPELMRFKPDGEKQSVVPS